MALKSPGFDRMMKRVRLSGILTTKTGLHVGGGTYDDAGTDLSVICDARGMPMIPGSGLKGVLRSTVEAMVRTVQKGALWSCNPLVQQRMKSPDDPEGACGYHATGKRSEIDIDHSCAVCRLFGNHVLASHVRVSDAIIPERMDPAPIEHRDGVAIDRDFKVVAGSQKYDFDVVSPGTRFDVEIFIDNPDDALMGLLVSALDQIDAGLVAIGGFTSRGLGRVNLEITETQIFTPRSYFLGQDEAPLDGEVTRTQFGKWREALTALATPLLEGGA